MAAPKTRDASRAVTLSTALSICTARVALPEPAALEAPSATLKVPACLGTPRMTPEDVSMDSPAGRPEAVKATGDRVAEIRYSKAPP
ncbi:MAG: hypothetical protein RLZZ221_2862 [Verrucomicrobiota bacterium]